MTQAEYCKDWRQLRAEVGLCQRCPNVVKKYRYCMICRAKLAAAMQARYALRQLRHAS